MNIFLTHIMSAEKLYHEIYKVINDSIRGKIVSKNKPNDAGPTCARNICNRFNLENYRYVIGPIYACINNNHACGEDDVRRCAEAVFDILSG